MIGRIIGYIFTLAVGALMITLFVINRHDVTMVLDPFNPKAPAYSLPMPFFLWMFAFLFIGAILGWLATWFGQGKWRRTARQRTQEAMRWKAEAERLARERDDKVIERKQLVAS